jgi:hypothetical protein
MLQLVQHRLDLGIILGQRLAHRLRHPLVVEQRAQALARQL